VLISSHTMSITQLRSLLRPVKSPKNPPCYSHGHCALSSTNQGANYPSKRESCQASLFWPSKQARSSFTLEHKGFYPIHRCPLKVNSRRSSRHPPSSMMPLATKSLWPRVLEGEDNKPWEGVESIFLAMLSHIRFCLVYLKLFSNSVCLDAIISWSL
jgi:hypothetical protein